MEKTQVTTASGTVLEAFDYSSLDADQRRLAQDAARFIDERQRGIASAVLEIGAKLNEVKASLGHGHFTAWVEASFTMTARTAQNYMQAAMALGSKSETVSYLPVGTVYEIARASEPVRARVMEEIETAPEPLSATKVQGLIWQANEEAKAAAIEAKKSPNQRKNDKARRAKQERASREADLAYGRMMAKRERNTVHLAEMLIDKLGDGVTQAAEMFAAIHQQDFARRLTGDLYGTARFTAGEVRAITKDEWLAHIAKLENGERPSL